MTNKLNIAFFGSSLVSAYWNGAATNYRGIIRAHYGRGHHVTFFEPDAYERQRHRDIADPQWAKVVVYPADEDGVQRALEQAQGADVIVKASGVGVFDELLEAAVPTLGRADSVRVYWVVDAPATLARMEADARDPLRAQIPKYDLVFTYGGGDPVMRRYRALGAQYCVPIYNVLDACTHYPVLADARFTADLGFVGNRLPDREARVEKFFLAAAAALPERQFLLAGSGWDDKPIPRNVRYLGHLYTRDHNAFNCTPRAVLNISRDSMADNGYSPATRVFEAAGAGACLICDRWAGIEQFLEPGREILVADDGAEVAALLEGLSAGRWPRPCRRARARVLAEHTYDHRAAEVERLLVEACGPAQRGEAAAGTSGAA